MDKTRQEREREIETRQLGCGSHRVRFRMRIKGDKRLLGLLGLLELLRLLGLFLRLGLGVGVRGIGVGGRRCIGFKVWVGVFALVLRKESLREILDSQNVPPPPPPPSLHSSNLCSKDAVHEVYNRFR
jgi:hypothetical protein